MNTDRNKVIDISKSIALILVVIGHAIIGNIRENSDLWNVIYDTIYSFHMFFFFLVSGYLFQHNYMKYYKRKGEFIKKKATQLLIPYVFISILEYSMILILSITDSNPIFSKIGGILRIPTFDLNSFIVAVLINKNHYDVHLWFVYVLFFIFLINIIIKEKNVFRVLLAFIVVMFFRDYLFVYGEMIVSIMKFMVPFLIGRLLKIQEKDSYSILFFKRHSLICICLCLVILAGINYSVSQLRVFSNTWYMHGIIQEIQYITGLIGSAILYLIGSTLQTNKMIVKISDTLSRYTFDIYLLHQPFITAGISNIVFKICEIPSVAIMVATVAGVSISILFSKYVLRRNKISAFLVLGKSK